MEITEIKSALEAQRADLHQFLAKANEELKMNGEHQSETKSAIGKISEEMRALNARIAEIEQKGAVARGDAVEQKGDIARQFVDSEQFKSLVHGGASRARMEFKTAITNVYPASNDQPLVGADRLAGIIANPNRVLRVRDLLPTYATSSNLVEYAKENVFTNNAGPQYGTASPTQIENVAKPESGITFTLSSTPVITLAHNIPASRQVLDDSAMLEGYIRDRLAYGLLLEEEEEILTGTGASGTLNGLLNQATFTASSVTGTDTKIDVIRRQMAMLQSNEFTPEAVVLNPSDWQDIELTKATDGQYIFANPQSTASPRIWGLPVIATNTMTAGQCLVGAFSQAAAIFDRMSLVVEMFREHSDYAAKNMVLLQAEKRLALAVFRPLGLRKATF